MEVSVAGQGLFLQNIIAIIWDFDKTLSPHYMQKPLFEAYGINESQFWAEVNALPAYYARAGVNVQRDTCYLGHLLSYVRAGRMPGLTNQKLRELGKEITFYPGLPGLFERLRNTLNTETFRESDLRIEHYVVSTGLRALIEGSAIAPYLDGIWASEFIETPAFPETVFSQSPQPGLISQIAGLLDHTTKTRALFEINKGVNKLPTLSVNDTIPEDERRVPFHNMVYIADGPSDIPSFSVVRGNGGLAYAVYDPTAPEQFAQVTRLLETGRVDMTGPADYQPGSATDMWLHLKVNTLASRIMKDRANRLEQRVAQGPIHLEPSPKPHATPSAQST